VRTGAVCRLLKHAPFSSL